MANRIRELRCQRGLTLVALAGMLDTTAWQISRLENGQRRMSDGWVLRLAKALEVQPGDLFEFPQGSPNPDHRCKTRAEVIVLMWWRQLSKSEKRAFMLRETKDASEALQAAIDRRNSV